MRAPQVPPQRGCLAWFVIALVAGALVALWPADAAPSPLPYLDKLAHALGFAVLWVLGRTAGARPLPLALGLLAYGAAIEALQALTPTRHASWADGLANALGLLLGHAVLAWRVAVRGG